MTDKELLELAAKAAGIELGWYTPYASLGDFRQIPDWNPLTDDGDALRLAVKLRISIQVAETNPEEPETAYWANDDWQYVTGIDTDPYAATRRAIVRAAAAIGESM